LIIALVQTTPFEAIVPLDLADLVPIFLRRRRRELLALRHALAKSDYRELLHLSHRMKGVGDWYGFPQVSALGARIEASAASRDTKALEALIVRYSEYLGNVQVTLGPPS
jgi:HPt (histidine-containing phosphotransfer) domain-containing protein